MRLKNRPISDYIMLSLIPGVLVLGYILIFTNIPDKMGTHLLFLLAFFTTYFCIISYFVIGEERKLISKNQSPSQTELTSHDSNGICRSCGNTTNANQNIRIPFKIILCIWAPFIFYIIYIITYIEPEVRKDSPFQVIMLPMLLNMYLTYELSVVFMALRKKVNSESPQS